MSSRYVNEMAVALYTGSLGGEMVEFLVVQQPSLETSGERVSESELRLLVQQTVIDLRLYWSGREKDRRLTRFDGEVVSPFEQES